MSNFKVKKAIRHPILIWRFLKGDREIELSKRHLELELERVSQVSFSVSDEMLRIAYRAIEYCVPRICYSNAFLYHVVKALRNQTGRQLTVVETGVHYGASSAFMLKALHEVGGSLYSIDLPNQTYDTFKGVHYDLLPSNQSPGFAIPNHLRRKFNLILGDSRTKLPRLLESLGQIDLFFHDSAHTYDLMSFEFEAAWPYIRNGGLLISDDIAWNNAFQDFVGETKTKHIIKHGKGIALKT